MRFTTRCGVLLCALIGGGASGCGSDAGQGGDATPLEPFVIVAQKEYLDYPERGSALLIDAIFPEQLSQDEREQQFGHFRRPIWEQSIQTPFGCKVWDFMAEGPGLDEGTLQIEVDGVSDIPPCTFQPDVSTPSLRGSYRCTGATGEGGDITVVDAEAGIFALTDPAGSFTAEDAGRHVDIDGASVELNNGDFPIVEVVDSTTIHFENTSEGAAAEAGGAARYATVAGFGPAGVASSLPADANVTIALDAGGGQDLESFSVRFEIGEPFTLDTPSQAILSNIPMDGSEFVVACNGDGGECGLSGGSVLDIRTSDAPMDPGFPPWKRPQPVSRSIQLLCVALSGRIVVPAEASAFLRDSGATRVEALFARAANAIRRQPAGDIFLTAAHVYSGITTIAPE